ncbi:MAG: ribosome biogenesis GTP-binding protein YihA/YsxC [Pseudomonadota bacterium]
MSMLLSKAKFLRSASAEQDFPDDIVAEIAFCGRSNAGKSSAINTLCRQNNLARTSKTPGRTQLINFFKLDGDTCLVDLPGYGYAKAPANVQQKWQQLMENYLTHRQALCGLVLLMDIRHPLTEIDWTMIHWTHHYQLPLYILLTKADKVNRNDTAKAMTLVSSKLEQHEFDCGLQTFSATKQIGVNQAQNKITDWLNSALTSQG